MLFVIRKSEVVVVGLILLAFLNELLISDGSVTVLLEHSNIGSNLRAVDSLKPLLKLRFCFDCRTPRLCFLFALLFIGESGGSRACSCRDFRLVSGEVHGRTRRELSKSLISGVYFILLHTHLLQSVYVAVEIGVKVGNIIFLALELLHPSAVGVETVLILYARHTSRTLIHCAGAIEFLRVRSNGIVDVFLFELEVNELALILGDFLLRSLSTRGENDIRGECAIFLRSFACKYCLLCEIAEHLRVDFLQLFNRCNTLFLRFCLVLSG